MKQTLSFIPKLEPLGILIVIALIIYLFVPKFLAEQNINTEEHFPDPTFRQEVQDFMGVSEGESFTKSEAAQKAGRLICEVTGIQSLQGLQYFTRISQFAVRGGTFNELDMSNQPRLKQLFCPMNKPLSSLNLSNNNDLIVLECMNNELKELDLSNNPKIEDVFCGFNQLTQLDVRKNRELFKLICQNNQLKSIEFSSHPTLMFLGCPYNELTELEVEKCSGLSAIDCSFNFIKSLDVTNNPDLRTLNCSNNKITHLDLSQNPMLVYVDCSNNPIEYLDISNNRELNILDIRGTKIKSVNAKNNFHLRNIVHDGDVDIIR